MCFTRRSLAAWEAEKPVRAQFTWGWWTSSSSKRFAHFFFFLPSIFINTEVWIVAFRTWVKLSLHSCCICTALNIVNERVLVRPWLRPEGSLELDLIWYSRGWGKYLNLLLYCSCLELLSPLAMLSRKLCICVHGKQHLSKTPWSMTDTFHEKSECTKLTRTSNLDY